MALNLQLLTCVLLILFLLYLHYTIKEFAYFCLAEIITFKATKIWNVIFILISRFFFLEIPIVETLCLVMHVAIFNLGYGCLGYPMMAELLPSKLRTSGLAFIMVVGGLFGFANSMSFVQLEAFIQQQEIFFTYAGINILGLVYLFFFLPNIELIS